MCKQGVANPLGDHRVARLCPSKFGDTHLPGLLVPDLAWALQDAPDNRGVGFPRVMKEAPLPTGTRGSTAPASNSLS